MTDRRDWYDCLEAFGDRTAVIDEAGNAVTYAALAALSDAAAATYAGARFVAIAAERDLATIVAYLGCLRRRIPVLMLEAGEKSDRLLAKFGPDLVVAAGEARAGGGDNSAVHPDLRLLLSTSGSTGSAKLVRLSARNIDSNAHAIAEYLRITPDDVAITTLPLFYSFGISVINSHLAVGAAIVLSDHAVTTPEFLDAVARHGVTSVAGVPTTYELLLSSGIFDKLPTHVREFTAAGGKLAPAQVTDLAARLRSRGGTLWVMYGQTEASPRMAYLPPEKIAAHPDCIGRAIPGGTLTIEADGAALPQGTVGELVYRGPNVMMGYATSRADLARGPELDALLTGDIAREVEPGLFRIEGRSARFVKPLGLRIGLDELETLAGPGVRIAGNDARGAVVVAIRNAELDAARAAHAPLKLPASVISYHKLDAIPQLGSGKIDYSAILQQTAQAHDAAASHAGAAEIEKCFRRAARGAAVSDQTTYAQLTGDSLSFIETSIVIENALGHARGDWASVPLGELKAAAAAHRHTGAATGLMRSISPDILVRALAIVLVVLQHAFGTFEGGADVMMVLAGLSWARFQRARITELGVGRSLWITLGRLMAIYYCIVIAYGLLKKQLFLSHLLLYSTFLGDWGGSLNIYWFIESLVWCTVVTGVAFAAVGPERVRRNPLAFTIGLFVVALGVRYVGELLLDAPAHRMRSPDQMLAYFAGGAILADAAMRGKLVIVAILVALSSFAWGLISSHSVIMAVCCLLLISHWQLVLPKAAHWLTRLVARNSFYIYIMQIVPMYLVDQLLKAEHGRYWPLHIVVSIGIGLGVGLLLDRYDAVLRGHTGKARDAIRGLLGRRRAADVRS